MSNNPTIQQITYWHYLTDQLKQCNGKIKAMWYMLDEIGEQINEINETSYSDQSSLESDSELELSDDIFRSKNKIVKGRVDYFQKQLQDVRKSKYLVEENFYNLQKELYMENDALENKSSQTNSANDLNDDSFYDLETLFKEQNDEEVAEIQDNYQEKQKPLFTLSEQSILKEIHLNFKANSNQISDTLVLQQQDIDDVLKDKNLSDQKGFLHQQLVRFKLIEDKLIYYISLFKRIEKENSLSVRQRKLRKIQVKAEGQIKIQKNLEQKLGEFRPALVKVLKSIAIDKLIEDTF